MNLCTHLPSPGTPGEGSGKGSCDSQASGQTNRTLTLTLSRITERGERTRRAPGGVTSVTSFLVAILIALLTGCVEPPRFTPANISRTDNATSPLVIPIELPHRGIPALLLGSSDDPTIAVIDTGAAANLVTPEWIAKQKLKTRQVPNLRLVDALGKKRPAPNVARVPSLTIDSLSFQDFDVMVDESVRTMDSHVDVMLGAPLFENVLVTLDYKHRRLVLEPGASLPPINGKDILPLRTTKDGHLQVQAKLLGEDAWLILDTGHTGDGLTLSRFRLIALPWASTPVEAGQVQTMLGTHALRAGRMNGDITLGQFTLHHPIVSIGFNDSDEFIGADTLQHFIVTIDQKHERIRFRSSESSDVIQFPPIRRLGFTLRDRTGTIEVTPNSAAAQSGLKTGDAFVSLNDTPLARFNYRYYEYLERLGEPMTVRVTRAGRTMSLTFVPTVVIP